MKLHYCAGLLVLSGAIAFAADSATPVAPAAGSAQLVPPVVQAAPPAQAAPELPISEIIWSYKEPTFKLPKDKRISLTAELGFQSSYGSSTFEQVNTAFTADYANGIDELLEDITYQYLIPSTQKATTNRLFSRTAYDRYLGYHLWAFAMTTYEYNPLKNLGGDIHVGAGLKYDIFRNSFWKMNIAASLMGRNQWGSSPGIYAQQGRTDLVSSLRYMIKVMTSFSEMAMIVYYQPSLTDANNGLLVDAYVLLNPKDIITVRVGFNYYYYADPLFRAAPGIDSGQYIRLVYKL